MEEAIVATPTFEPAAVAAVAAVAVESALAGAAAGGGL